ncbi:MAG: protein arginine kinase [Phycisphaerales bacterium]
MSDPSPDPRSADRPGAPLPLESTTPWLLGEGDGVDVVMSSRVRLARNIAQLPFLPKSGRADRQRSLQMARERIFKADLAPRMVWIDLHDATPHDRTLLVERHLISKQHSKGRATPGTAPADDPRAVAFSVPDERLSVMVNEEDHLRIQVVMPGIALSQAWQRINDVDDRIEAGIDYAFSPRFGYLTACPTNVGTGLRMSAMLHLPALRLTGELDKVKRAAQDMSLAVRGFYGEGSDAVGDLYQISNQSTLGRTEEAILRDLEQDIIPKVVEYERVSRRELLTKRRLGVEDQVFRAYGTLLHARLLATDEAMQLLSTLRLGVVLGIIKGLAHQKVNRLMLAAQPAHLQRIIGTELDQEQRRAARAAVLRAELSKP